MPLLQCVCVCEGGGERERVIPRKLSLCRVSASSRKQEEETVTTGAHLQFLAASVTLILS